MKVLRRPVESAICALLDVDELWNLKAAGSESELRTWNRIQGRSLDEILAAMRVSLMPYIGGGRVKAADVAVLAAEMTPYVSAAVGAYGGAVLATVQDEAADATVGLGRRLLQRVFGSRREGEALPGPLADLAADPGDGDGLAAVRLTVRRALVADPVLAVEVRSMLAGAPRAAITGDIQGNA